MKRLGLWAALTAVVLAWPAYASALTINAVGQGTCSQGGGCIGPNTYAGYSPSDNALHRNFFRFQLPDVQIAAATIEIWNYNTAPSSDTFSLYHRGDVNNPPSFGVLKNGPVLGSINIGDANAVSPGYVSIALNSTAIAELNQVFANGGFFTFGGSTGSVDAGVMALGLFGDAGNPLNLPHVARLELTTTPLPGALPLFASGCGALGLIGWRRKRKAVRAA